MAAAVVIADARARVVVLPDLGAGIAAFDLVDGPEPLAVFRRAPDPDTSDPFALGCNLLLPWSNRISGGGFRFRGEFHALPPNLAGEPFPIHGNAFQVRWTVRKWEPARVQLSLRSDGLGPFRYQAIASYALDGGCLSVELSVENAGDRPLPFGAGIHPWFPRTRSILLKAPAETVWLEDDQHLPVGRMPVSSMPEWDFSAARRLPHAWINNGFTSWSREAEIFWPDRRLMLTVQGSSALSSYILYSPSDAADFFCFEPVTHPVDAHNLLGRDEGAGLAVLSPSESLQVRCRFSPSALP